MWIKSHTITALAQFLHAMNGGELWQHVEGHAGPDHLIYDVDEDVYVTANSYHHQMLMFHKDMDLLAVCEDQVSKVFKNSNVLVKITQKDQVEMEIEAGSYPGSRCFFVQGHPEVGSPEYKSWCLTKLSEFCQGYGTWHVNATQPVKESMDAWDKARNIVAV